MGDPTKGDKPTLVVVQSENSNFNIGVVLDETNYDLWAPLIEMHIAGRRKMGYLRGSIKAPSEDDPKYKDWEADDQRNEVRVYTLSQKASRLRQNGRPVSTYFGELSEIFQELDHYSKVAMHCDKDIKVYQESLERQRVYLFLGGLDDEFEQVRGEVLRKEPPLGLHGSYAFVRRESDRKEAMKQEARRQRPWWSATGPPTTDLARCFELIGYPEGWDKTRDPRYNKQRATIADTKDEPDLVANPASALVTTTGNEGKVLQISDSVKNTTWIIDSGATAHMTFDSKLVHTVNPSTQSCVTTADGSAAPIIGEGPVTLPDNLNLDTVLIVPSLDYNLLSVAQLTVALNCVVVFWPHYCVFRDIQTQRTIGYGIRKGKLYYMDLRLDSTSRMNQALSVDTSHGKKNPIADIWLWHRRLGHASFGYLQNFFQGERRREVQTLDYTLTPDRVVVDNLDKSSDMSLDESGENSGENPQMTESDTPSVPVLQHAPTTPTEQVTSELDIQHQSNPITEPDEPMQPEPNAVSDNQSPPMTDVHPPRLPPRSNRGLPCLNMESVENDSELLGTM
ncbi:hypothetical protein MRB53_035959 [Persea americana]|uniref:Uncharacterized protein n=1 Tax=Persea americana TaxID=3435 RepID=A0ACC2K641_PERAE|nr:hypothetical protein MRB53_035959 [Persea americana]